MKWKDGWRWDEQYRIKLAKEYLNKKWRIRLAKDAGKFILLAAVCIIGLSMCCK